VKDWPFFNRIALYSNIARLKVNIDVYLPANIPSEIDTPNIAICSIECYTDQSVVTLFTREWMTRVCIQEQVSLDGCPITFRAKLL
jgi:hypothetical protein